MLKKVRLLISFWKDFPNKEKLIWSKKFPFILRRRKATLFVISDEFKFLVSWSIWFLEDTISRYLSWMLYHAIVHWSTQSLFNCYSWEAVYLVYNWFFFSFRESLGLKMRGVLIHYMFVQVFFFKCPCPHCLKSYTFTSQVCAYF